MASMLEVVCLSQALQLIGAIEDGPPPCFAVEIPGIGRGAAPNEQGQELEPIHASDPLSHAVPRQQ